MSEAADANLTDFEKIAVLRDELSARTKDLNQLERRLGGIRTAMERRKFLWSVSPDYYKGQPPPEGAKELQPLLQQKTSLETVIAQLGQAKADIESRLENRDAASGEEPQKPASPQTPSDRRHRLASFD